MIGNPKSQIKLYGHELLLLNLIDLFNEAKLPNKIILSGPKGIGKCTTALHLSNYIFSLNEICPYDKINNEINSNNRSYKLVHNSSHPNFHMIDLPLDKKNIEIGQIRNLINFTNKSSFNNSPKIILIDNLECLNLNSTNALLKIVEEPNENTFFILIHNNNKQILNTLRSRCINFKMYLSHTENISISNKLIEDNIFNFLNHDIINYYNTVGDYIYLINFSKNFKINLIDLNLKNLLLLLINQKNYIKDYNAKILLFNFIELYFLKLTLASRNKKDLYKLYSSFIIKINTADKFNLDYDSIFMEFKKKIINE